MKIENSRVEITLASNHPGRTNPNPKSNINVQCWEGVASSVDEFGVWMKEASGATLYPWRVVLQLRVLPKEEPKAAEKK